MTIAAEIPPENAGTTLRTLVVDRSPGYTGGERQPASGD